LIFIFIFSIFGGFTGSWEKKLILELCPGSSGGGSNGEEDLGKL